MPSQFRFKTHHHPLPRRSKIITKALKKVKRGPTALAMALLAGLEKKQRNKRLEKRMRDYL